MAGISQKEYNEQVDEALIMFGGSSPCVNIDPRMWGDFKHLFKEYNEQVPKTVDWSFDQVHDWLEAYKQQDTEE